VNDKSNDQASFSDLMTGVKKLEDDRINVYRHRIKKTGLPKRGAHSVDSNPDFASIDYQQRSGIRESQFDVGIQRKLQRKIRQGAIRPEDSIDLHGYRQAEALLELDGFMSQAIQRRYRMILIIHGQGYRSQSEAVLKPLVQRWLSEQSQVLAWCPAQLRDGAGGASYVYLRGS